MLTQVTLRIHGVEPKHLFLSSVYRLDPLRQQDGIFLHSVIRQQLCHFNSIHAILVCYQLQALICVLAV